jgi:hypothetical protein
MKKQFTLALLCLACMPMVAQTFDSGSDGSYGPLNITSNTTLNLPPDGIFKCTTIFITNGATLKFNRNALNTPVYLLATSNVTIIGAIDVAGENGTTVFSGLGGPGGFDGGNPGQGINKAGAGLGPGGGRPGTTGFGASSAGPGGYGSLTTLGSTNRGSTYGSPLLVPLVGGSGAGGQDGGVGGGGGGGAVLIASNVRIDLAGTITAAGGLGVYNDASGGAIRLVAPVLAGTGTLNVSGHYAGDGRVRLDTLDRRLANFNYIAGAATVSSGALMIVFPSPLPRLDIVEAAGTSIAVGAASPVIVQLPFGSTSNRTVTVRAQDFNAAIPVAVVLTPEQGSPIVYTNVIDNLATNPTTNVFNVVIPVNVVVKVNAWTR